MIFHNRLLCLTKFYSFGLVAVESGYVSVVQLKTLVSVALRYTKTKRRVRGQRKLVGHLNAESYGKNRYTYPVFLSKYGKFRSLLSKRFGIRSVVKSKMLGKLRGSRHLKRLRIKLGVWPRFPLTCKSLGVRMGKGKGAISFWHCPVRVGKVVLQIRGDVDAEKALFALFQLQRRLPFKTRVVCKDLTAYRFYCYNYRPLYML